MQRFLVERGLPGGLVIPANEAGAEARRRVVEENAALGVAWLHSYVTHDKEQMFCIYDAPTPDAIRQAGNETAFRSSGSRL